ncbi:hypothetical protein LZ32DRAFT_207913 [Colletotrichum eremochloae]|nr:hypothetical protein LZ32DRAFT_207913 [Colletotrichum eremochloae]
MRQYVYSTCLRGNHLTTKNVYRYQRATSRSRIPAVCFWLEQSESRSSAPCLRLHSRTRERKKNLPPLVDVGARPCLTTPLSRLSLLLSRSKNPTPLPPSSRVFPFSRRLSTTALIPTLCSNTPTRSALNPHCSQFFVLFRQAKPSRCRCEPLPPPTRSIHYFQDQFFRQHVGAACQKIVTFNYRLFGPNIVRSLTRPLDKCEVHCMSGTEAPKVKQSK